MRVKSSYFFVSESGVDIMIELFQMDSYGNLAMVNFRSRQSTIAGYAQSGDGSDGTIFLCRGGFITVDCNANQIPATE